jgi:ectoine hydroxylase-related dioxygenase (phytanoyl-CoA dioxygenase family)
MKAFRELSARNIEHIDLKQEIDRYGYLLIRGLLSLEDIRPLTEQITKVLFSAGWLDPLQSPIDRIANDSAACAEGDGDYKRVSDEVFDLCAFHEFPHHPALQVVMKSIVGSHLLIHPKSAIRLIFPHFERGIIHAHQDHTAIGGDEETYTAWLPLHDCPLHHGSLKILEGSHRYGRQAIDHDTGYTFPNAQQGESWVGGDIYAGDLLLFHSLTVHEAAPNLSQQLRISIDCRFQSFDNPVNPATLVFTGTSNRSWDDIYAKWPANDLKYYWLKLPLTLKPSKQELADLVETSPSPKMQARYARILERIQSQVPIA